MRLLTPHDATTDLLIAPTPAPCPSPAPSDRRPDPDLPPPSGRRSRRTRVALAALAGAVLVVALAACSPEQDHIRDLANAARAANGRPALAQDTGLDDKATYVARSIAASHTLTHSNLPDGAPPGWRKLGENIGYGPSIDAVQGAYMNSPPHRANILDPAFNHVGTGYATGRCPTSSATCVYTVQEFGQY